MATLHLWFVILINFLFWLLLHDFLGFEQIYGVVTHVYFALLHENSVCPFGSLLISSWVHGVGVGNKLINFIHSLCRAIGR